MVRLLSKEEVLKRPVVIYRVSGNIHGKEKDLGVFGCVAGWFDTDILDDPSRVYDLVLKARERILLGQYPKRFCLFIRREGVEMLKNVRRISVKRASEHPAYWKNYDFAFRFLTTYVIDNPEHIVFDYFVLDLIIDEDNWLEVAKPLLEIAEAVTDYVLFLHFGKKWRRHKEKLFKDCPYMV